ncbi:hypothetical protein CK203_061760 [Vitis vinifera]|uniref:Uncharacterized protein n=1 Tax=Vitis vinifera TaxID=29760 RepID=A0A438GSK3_VITVI|nr:hypothetical protein CK203_061760 [Vitis vinifera]
MVGPIKLLVKTTHGQTFNGSSSSKNLTWVFILVLVQICGCKGCIKEEK